MRRASEWLNKHKIERGLIWPEVMFACVIIAWGIAFLTPTQAFALSGNYNALAAIAPEEVWGAWLDAIGVAWLVTVVANRHVPRAIAGIIGGGVLLWMALSIYLSNPNSTWAGPTSIIGFFAVYSVVRQVMLWTRLQR